MDIRTPEEARQLIVTYRGYAVAQSRSKHQLKRFVTLLGNLIATRLCTASTEQAMREWNDVGDEFDEFTEEIYGQKWILEGVI